MSNLDKSVQCLFLLRMNTKFGQHLLLFLGRAVQRRFELRFKRLKCLAKYRTNCELPWCGKTMAKFLPLIFLGPTK